MQKKKVLSLVLTLAMVFSLFATIPITASAAPGYFNVDDIKVINEIIAVNGLKWAPDTALDGSAYPGDWLGRVIWSIGPNARIIALNINGNDLTGTLNVSGLTELYYLDCANNNLTSLNVSGLRNLTTLICHHNLLVSLNASGLTELADLDCSENFLTSLNVSTCTALKSLICYENLLTSLSLPSGTNLKEIHCRTNRLTSLPTLPASLEHLDLYDNQLTALPSLPSGLTWLGCGRNQLTSLPALPAGLVHLECYSNQLTSLPTLPVGLDRLDCSGNYLSGFDVTGLNVLRILFCHRNEIPYEEYNSPGTHVIGVNSISDFTAWGTGGFHFSPQRVPGFVPTEYIINLPKGVKVGAPLTLTGTVVPSNATHKTIIWEILSAGATGATLSGPNNDILTTTFEGWISMRALIKFGQIDGAIDSFCFFSVYSSNDGIGVPTPPAPPPPGGGTDNPGDGTSNPGGGQPPVTVVIVEEETPLDETPLSVVSSYADELYKLGLFRGTSTDADGKPVYSLEGPLTRLQALILTIRLLGLEEEALAYTGPNPFKDVTYSANVPYVAFAYSKGLTKGVSAATFAPDRQVTCQQFTTFLLRTLGYIDEDGVNTVYLNALDIALELEMYDDELLADLGSGVFLRGDAVVAMVRALLTPIKGADEKLLIDTLVEAEIFPQEAADVFIEAIAKLK